MRKPYGRARFPEWTSDLFSLTFKTAMCGCTNRMKTIRQFGRTLQRDKLRCVKKQCRVQPVVVRHRKAISPESEACATKSRSECSANRGGCVVFFPRLFADASG